MAILVLIASFVVAFALCASLIPFFRRAFLVTPGARSSHVEATPQGGGLVVIPVAIVLTCAALTGMAGMRPDPFACSLIAALLLLMALGGWDDLAALNPGFRLVVQAGAAALALAVTPLDFTGPIAFLAPAIVYACLLIGMLWFINLTNFMDGIDLMSVTQFVPAFATVYLLLAGLAGAAQWVGALCLASAGGLLGFALLNRPRARLFLGDSGSLPLGLLGAIALLVVGNACGAVVALLPFLYYIADASVTLARRVLAGEKFWQAHRQHFYQRATRCGLSTWQVIARVAACNILLCALALLIAGRSLGAQAAALALGVVIVALLMSDLVRKRS
ncbi:glycosyl transferase [Methylocapsa sp. S129]|uniref:glycosyl transferase n=1 Tax=Methylocapsa sp. S129 TaxID=1641869 RepID=UPI00131ADDEE|nr:glycosyl transferase [Methylocapsa sp. S129]